jgi:hypothetical protein
MLITEIKENQMRQNDHTNRKHQPNRQFDNARKICDKTSLKYN